MNEHGNAPRPLRALPEAPAGENRALSTQTIERLFARLLAMYGAKFSDQWAGLDHEHVKSVWAEELSALSDDEIVTGIRELVRAGKTFPPTLPEFFAICRPVPDVPPANDHPGLDAFARKHAIATHGCDSYHALRQRIIEELQQRRIGSTRLPYRVAL